MKVIDLYNKIANGEKVPTIIKYNTFELKRTMSNNLLRMYVDEEGMFFPEYYSGLTLNDEVKILEEPKEIPEKLDGFRFKKETADLTAEELEIENYLCDMTDTINKILDYLESKGDD